MASLTYQCSDLRHVVFHRLEPESPSPTSNSTQDIEVTITLQLDLKRHYCLTNQFIDLDEEGPLFFQETVRFDLRVLRNPYRAALILGLVLRRHYITHNSPSYDAIIDDIIRHGHTIGNWKSNKGRQVLPLLVEISGTLVQHVNYEEDEGLIGRALEESASELETSNYNMVPAKESSVKKMLKRVRVEGGDRDGENIKKRRVIADECVICLEELKVGSDASRMPCSHTFHGDCIEKWLKQSHYCPICRLEMPTE
ncbi:LOW QUALITY PROTEIN: E3 ubiquitin-protein ligase RNF165-like [Herrania umbratica]|uniref:RING-type E3 ubiquitin transferase n=1 Tax=Herrania umbratica TaxID=108875 RepID=A0A6J1BK90_9ROSI|nr:LOW QUALITY PROTEIN: E3 ubiquitin-protein ligase RNF165-like [Herrania umbratica]